MAGRAAVQKAAPYVLELHGLIASRGLYLLSPALVSAEHFLPRRALQRRPEVVRHAVRDPVLGRSLRDDLVYTFGVDLDTPCGFLPDVGSLLQAEDLVDVVLVEVLARHWGWLGRRIVHRDVLDPACFGEALLLLALRCGLGSLGQRSCSLRLPWALVHESILSPRCVRLLLHADFDDLLGPLLEKVLLDCFDGLREHEPLVAAMTGGGDLPPLLDPCRQRMAPQGAEGPQLPVLRRRDEVCVVAPVGLRERARHEKVGRLASARGLARDRRDRAAA